MFSEISYEELLKIKNYIIVDVRTPKEYAESTIPNAINIPIFSNEEREIIGTTYKKIGVEDAKILGLKFVGSKLSEIYIELRKKANGNQIVLFCARGGLRSRVLSQTMAALGLPIIKIDFGYKGYRNFVLKELPSELEKVKLVTLFGKTGVGKTNVLKYLSERGADVLDLEALANHRGSLFGSVGLNVQNSQKQFENLVLENLLNRKSDIIFTEAESKRIGNIVMPNYLHEKVMSGEEVLIESSISKRVLNIHDEYLSGKIDKEGIISAIMKLSKYVSSDKIDKYLFEVNSENYDYIIEDLMINYYDKNYNSRNKIFSNVYNNEDDFKTAEMLFENFFDK